VFANKILKNLVKRDNNSDYARWNRDSDLCLRDQQSTRRSVQPVRVSQKRGNHSADCAGVFRVPHWAGGAGGHL
jgi:hypothetical protein